MDTGSMFSYMDVIVIGCGVYGIYSWYMLVKKQEIKKTFLVGGNHEPEDCTDVKAFADNIGTKLLITSIGMIVFAAFSMFHDYVYDVGVFYWAALISFLALLIWYCMMLRKANLEFFKKKSSRRIKDKALNKK